MVVCLSHTHTKKALFYFLVQCPEYIIIITTNFLVQKRKSVAAINTFLSFLFSLFSSFFFFLSLLLPSLIIISIMSAAETAPRKRNNSIIPLEFRNDTSDGGMERAALATVFGVREYTESKIFWNADEESAQDITATPTASTLHRNSSRKSYSTTSHRGSTNMMQTSGVLSVSPSSLQASPPPPPVQHRSLPKIPVVSEFGDIWSDTYSATAVAAADNNKKSTTGTAPSHTAQHPFQLLPPTDLSDFPLTIFDLLESDENPNLILWGIYAKQHTTVPSTAPPTADERDHTTPHNSNNKKKSRWSAQQLIPLKKLKKKASVDLPSTAVPEPPSQQHQAAAEDRVIEAATIEKLVEKLTISLGKKLPRLRAPWTGRRLNATCL